MKKTIKLNFLARATMMLLLAVFTSATAWADAPDHKIVVIADPHVMGDGLLTDPSNSDWTEYINGSRKLIDYSQALFDKAVTDISQMAEKPELVLIVGDLTKDGELASHNYVRTKLAALKTAGIQTLVIPGNHDLGTTTAKVYGETTSDATTIGTAATFASLYTDYGYGASSERLENTLSYACEPITGLVVIGIDSGTNGVLSETTLNWVCTKARAARAAGKQVIAMMHHPLIPHITGGDTFVSSASIANYETVRNSLADAGISTIFTGHFHTSDIAKDWNADKSKTIFDITTGALCSYPCDYRVVTLNNTMTTMSIATSTVTGASTISENDAKTRLNNSMKTIISAKVKAKLLNEGLINNETVAGILAASLAPYLANAYIYHAEGNENKNDDAQTLLETLLPLFQAYPSYQKLLNSMLEDKSNYGDTDREDQTNDRTLEIEEFTFTEGQTWMTWCSSKGYTLPEGLEAYTISGLSADGKSVVLAPTTSIPADTPLLLKGTEGTTYAALWSADGSATGLVSSTVENVLTFYGNPTDETISTGNYCVPGKSYVLSKGKFILVDADGGVPAHRCWLTLNGSNARQLNISFDEATGMYEVPCTMYNSDDAWYDLQGRKLSSEPTRKGLYIYKGKKVKR